MPTRRSLPLAAALAAAGALSVHAQSPITYAPATARYHLISVISRDQTVQGQHHSLRITNEQQVSVRITAHARDTLDFSYTIDSSHITADPPVDIPDVSKMVGTSVHGTMSRAGKIYTYTSSVQDNDPDGQNLVHGMTRFLMVLPSDAHVGSTWADTTKSTVRQNGSNLELSTVATARILGDTVYAGQKAWRVQRTLDLTLVGNQSQLGTITDLNGKGTGTGMYYLSARGLYLGSVSTQTMHIVIKPEGGTESVPVDQVVTATVELVK